MFTLNPNGMRCAKRVARAAACLALWGCAEQAPWRPDILLITLDTTRVDAIGAFGGDNARTPKLDGLAEESVVFSQAITTTPYTGPAHASILTGRFPPQHGLRDFLNQALSSSVPSLPELLSGDGYQTAAILASYVLDDVYGMARGFDTYSCDLAEGTRSRFFVMPPKGQIERRAGEIADEAIEWMDGREVGRPFFLWLHFYDPHWTYRPPPQHHRRGVRDLRRDVTERRRMLYYGEVSYVDAEIGRVLEALRDRGLYEQLVIAVVADHGEPLAERGLDFGEHSRTLADITLNVPLLIRVPGVLEPARVTTQVRTIDLLPTLLEAAGLEVPEGVEGVSLIDLARGRPDPPRPAYSETFYEQGSARAEEGFELMSLRLDGWKLVLRPGRAWLYDLENDPHEEEDVAARHPERVAALDAELLRLQQRWPSDLAPANLDLEGEDLEEHMERLRSLGYLD